MKPFPRALPCTEGRVGQDPGNEIGERCSQSHDYGHRTEQGGIRRAKDIRKLTIRERRRQRKQRRN